MAERKGKCTNIGNCPNADSGKVMSVPEGAEFVCTESECGLPLMPVKAGGIRLPIPARAVYLLLGLILIIGLAGLGISKIVEFRADVMSGKVVTNQLTGTARWLAEKFAPASPTVKAADQGTKAEQPPSAAGGGSAPAAGQNNAPASTQAPVQANAQPAGPPNGQDISQGSAAQKQPPVVGRITDTDGDFLRYVSSANDWVAGVKDTPAGSNEAFYTDQSGKGEFEFPNLTMVRMNDKTQIQFMQLKNDLTDVDVASGLARLVNQSASATIKAKTPFGYVVASPGTSFDMYVGDQSIEVVSLKGTVTFVPPDESNKYEVTAGQASLLCDGKQTGAGSSTTDADWNSWNEQRDAGWAKETESNGESVKRLPYSLRQYASALDENGEWSSVYNHKTKREVWAWKPTHVKQGWRPFTDGRWTDWEGDQCWAPAESFGYVTAHYGNWMFTDGAWYWTPPVMAAPVAGAPVETPVYWYPGRVGWFYSDGEIGWFPLAPTEVYYSADYWGPQSDVVVGNVGVNEDVGAYAYAGEAVVIDQSSFYSVNNYTSVNITDVNASVYVHDRGFRTGPLARSAAFRAAAANGRANRFSNGMTHVRPPMAVTNRVRQNAALARAAGPRTGRSVAGRVAAIPRNTKPLGTSSVPSARRVKIKE